GRVRGGRGRGRGGPRHAQGDLRERLSRGRGGRHPAESMSGWPDTDRPGARMGGAAPRPQSGDMTTMTVPEPLEDRRRSAPQAVDPPEPRSVGRWASRIGRFLAYGFLAMLLGAVGFSLVLGLLSAGISTVVVWIGLPILVAGVLVAHGFARAERAVQSAI